MLLARCFGRQNVATDARRLCGTWRELRTPGRRFSLLAFGWTRKAFLIQHTKREARARRRSASHPASRSRVGFVWAACVLTHFYVPTAVCLTSDSLIIYKRLTTVNPSGKKNLAAWRKCLRPNGLLVRKKVVGHLDFRKTDANRDTSIRGSFVRWASEPVDGRRKARIDGLGRPSYGRPARPLWRAVGVDGLGGPA